MSGHRHGKGLYKDSEEGILMGVCAGLAHYFGFSRIGVRIVTVISLLFLFWPTVIAYAIAGLMLRHRPLSYCGRDERGFWRHGSTR